MCPLRTFRKVQYSVPRPLLSGDFGEEWFEKLALTKAIEWEYEEEERFLLTLSDADRCVGSGIHLLNIPTAAVRSVTMGCRADLSTTDTVRRMLVESGAVSHVAILAAKVDQRNFALNYVVL